MMANFIMKMVNIFFKNTFSSYFYTIQTVFFYKNQKSKITTILVSRRDNTTTTTDEKMGIGIKIIIIYYISGSG